jgi:Xaa-Pro aminopeptidase
MDLIKQKIAQAASILQELDIDAWLVFVRETPMMADPVLPLVVGEDATWNSFFLYTRTGAAYALVGNFDRELFTRYGHYDEVMTYTQDAQETFCSLITKIDPTKLAINFSIDNPAADGLTYGMYTQLTQYLSDTPYGDRLVSAEDIISRLRSRKLDDEVRLLSHAAITATDVWDDALGTIEPGMTEIEIANVIDDYMARNQATNSFHTIVNAGDKSSPGHGRPSEAILERGDLLHIDFGARLEDYCSDIQRLAWFTKPGESEIPDELDKAFTVVRDIITETAAACRPGKQGWEIDALARKILTENGYPEYQHALGHQLGRDAHDGGAVLGPKWERYGVTPMIELELGNVFTLELEIMLPGIGCVGLEEDVVLEADGARFLCPRQEELVIL